MCFLRLESVKYCASCYWLSNCPALWVDFAGEEATPLGIQVPKGKMKKCLVLGAVTQTQVLPHPSPVE
jgi:hypothetical protein